MRSRATVSRVVLCGVVIASGLFAVPAAWADQSVAGQEVWLARYTSKAGASGNQDIAQAVAVDDTRGRIYVTGTSYGTNGTDYVTLAYDPTGAPLWLARLDGGSDDDVAAIAVDSGSGQVYVTGTTVTPAGDEVFGTVAYSSAGARLWTATFDAFPGGFDTAISLAIAPDGQTIYVTGQSGTPGTNDTDIATIAYDTTGAVRWQARFANPNGGSDNPVGIAVDGASGTVYVGGTTRAGTTNANFIIAAYDGLSGAQAWLAQYNGPSNLADSGYSIAVSPADGRVVITGRSDGATTSADYATVAYSAAGTRLWTKRYNGVANGDDDPTAVAFAPAGDAVYVTGSSSGATSGLDYLTVGYSADGAFLWSDRADGTASADDRPVAMDVDDATGNLYVTGGSHGAMSGLDATTAVYGPAGQRVGMFRTTGPGAGADVAYDVAVSAAQGQVYVVGANQRDLTGTDYATLAYALL